jgi:hypothetical protein
VSIHLKSHVESEWISLSVARCEIAEHDILGNLGVLNVRWPAIGFGLSISELQISVILSASGDDETIGAMVGLHDKGLSAANEE